MNATPSLPVHKLAWASLSAMVFFLCVYYVGDWPMEISALCMLLVPIVVGAVLAGWLLQFFWGIFVYIFPKPARRPPLKHRVLHWLIRGVYVSVLMAAVDCWSGIYFGHGIFSVTATTIRDGGTTISVGPGYFMTFRRHLDGDAYGPEVWFWFTPIVIDAAHQGTHVRWIWSH